MTKILVVRPWFWLFLLAWGLVAPVYADAPKVFFGSVPYQGAVRVDKHVVWVDVDSLARSVGWKIERHGAGVCLHRPSMACDAADSGFLVDARPYSGEVRTEGTSTWIALDALARFLGGQTSYDESLGLVQCSIPGMPVTTAQDPRSALVQQLASSPYTLVYYLLDTDPYCKHFTPVVRAFGDAHKARMRLVEFNLDKAKQGSNWIYGMFKTRDNGIPELVLLDSKGNVLQKLLGETDAKTLEKELGPLMSR